MGSSYHISIGQKLESSEQIKLQEGVEKILSSFSTSLSTYYPDSEISRFNRADPQIWIQFSPLAFDLLYKAWNWSKESQGAFDLTVGPLVQLWGFEGGKKREAPPPYEEILLVLKSVGYQHLKFLPQERKILKEIKNLRLDVSAIAPGYASDLITSFLAQQGYAHSMVEVGGEVRVSGFRDPLKKTPWKIGVEAPQDEGQKISRVLSLSNESVSTSGDYRDFFIYQGRRYSHTLDTRTGQPIQHGLSAVTVLQKECADADALATFLMVLGPERGLTYVNEKKIKAIFYVRSPKGMTEFLSDAIQKDF